MSRRRGVVAVAALVLVATAAGCSAASDDAATSADAELQVLEGVVRRNR